MNSCLVMILKHTANLGILYTHGHVDIIYVPISVLYY